ncbi:cytochrome b561 domain-containing protein 2 [Culex quinquefasciatus]|uniref:cytochrome b561 domain-containing protein 2 n=1 Tax=Culex quinquefasciatus TaxID=7176 RepID=UPI0018E2A12E|nr:cytochrome b561 domain-containing protein 2 [Culex quinquefasciatus]
MKSLVVDSSSGGTGSGGSTEDIIARSGSDAKVTWVDTVKFVVNTITHVLIGFVFIYTIWVCWKYGLEQIFAWHVVLCMTGFNLLMAEAILLFYSGNTWSQVMLHPQRRTVHWILQVVGSLCVIVGIALEYYWRDINNKLHFHDTHSILGLVALILMLLSMTNGLGALFSVELRRKIKPVYMKLGHQFVGLCCFVIGMAALVLGFDKKIFRNNSTPEMRTTLQVFTVLVILTSSLGVIRTILSQLKTLFR